MPHRNATLRRCGSGLNQYTDLCVAVPSRRQPLKPLERLADQMKPFVSTRADSGSLQDLGRASLQIVHDLKNQLNGLKLYATFLRKRLERSDRPEDEQETINKLISGLDRAANDLSTIVQYGREVELKKQPGFDLQKALRAICADLSDSTTLRADSSTLAGDFDPAKLTDALRWISLGAGKQKQVLNPTGVITISSKRESSSDGATAVIEWTGSGKWNHDPFRSFLGSDEIRMSLAAKIIEAHGGTATQTETSLVVRLPILDNEPMEN